MLENVSATVLTNLQSIKSGVYYYSYDGVPNSYFMLMNSMYFAIVCIIPLSIGFLVFLLMLIMLMVLIKNKNIYRKKG